MANQNESICIVLPTYNEAGNIELLLPKLTALAVNIKVLVVDDDSPDGTADLVRAAAANNSRIHLLTGQKKGLGVAYKRGMLHALNELGADIVIQMDADFSHDPEDIFQLIGLLDRNADVAIGSRHVAGGTLGKGWGIGRRILTYGGNFLMKLVVEIGDIQDCTSGFRAIKADLLRKVNFNAMPVDGFAFQVELLRQLLSQGAKVVEHPIHFANRRVGQTKLGLSDIAEFFIYCLGLGFSRFRMFMKFAVTGVSGVIVNLIIFQSLIYLDLDKHAASIIALEGSVLWNFQINDTWTFRAFKSGGNRLQRALRFNAANIVTMAISFGIFMILVYFFSTWPLWIAQLLAVLPVVPLNYYIGSRWIFGTRSSLIRGETYSK